MITVIEIGSRAARMLTFSVKDYYLNFFPEYNKAELNKINVPRVIEDNDFSQLYRTLEIITSFSEYARTQAKSNNVTIFGTQAMREIADSNKDNQQIIQDILPNMALLSPQKEALCSFHSAYALSGMKNGHNELSQKLKKLLVFDIGSGSTEIIYGGVGATSARKFTSIPLGGGELFNIFKKFHPNISMFNKFLDKEISQIDLSLNLKQTKVVLNGGIPTNLSWRINQANKKYSPELVHGTNIELRELEKYEKIILNMMEDKRIRLDDKNINDYIGIFFLVRLYNYFGINSASINGYGTRHGYAYLYAQEKNNWKINNISFVRNIPSNYNGT